jgi:hypothetical protein
MIINNADDFEKTILEFIEQQKVEAVNGSAEGSLQELKEALESPEARSFTDKINKLYEEQGIKDDDGEPLILEHPSDLVNKISWDSNNKESYFSITTNEDQWIRANKLYGSDILGKLGFKYTDS